MNVRGQPPDESALPRFCVGIDLGTTNSAVAFVDTHAANWQVETFQILQVVAPAEIEPRETLPSFHYEAAGGELGGSALALPWTQAKDEPQTCVGHYARDHGTELPGRLIASAKSWLCHAGVDRSAPLLPWNGAGDVTRLSPVEASSRYLAHIRQAWDNRHPADPLARQDVVLTLPASFDEVARELTVRAARLAGLPRVILVEEPQAAFYSWMHAHRESWSGRVSPGQKILVCDIGGGTTDFTLIRVRPPRVGEPDQEIRFHRLAVGEHLILGGDNMDLALGHAVEQKVARGDRLDPRSWSVLVRKCRAVKETLLGDRPPNRITLSLPGVGSRLVGGGTQVEIERREVLEILVDGFLPAAGLGDVPASRRSGFQEFSLPFAADPAITRHLASFLTAHRHAAVPGEEPITTAHDPARPDLVLFNGGFFASPDLRQRLLDVLSAWFSTSQSRWQPTVLANDRLDLAVAHGAAYYGMVRRGKGQRISGGLPRSYYVGIQADSPPSESLDGVAQAIDEVPATLDGRAEPTSPVPVPMDGNAEQPTPAPAEVWAVCLLPAGTEEGEAVVLDHPFRLAVRQPVEFSLYSSSTRLTDPAGAVLMVDAQQLAPLPPIRTVLTASRGKTAALVDVRLHAQLTEIGTLRLWFADREGGRSWELDFDVRSTTQTDVHAHTGGGEGLGVLETETVLAARDVIHQVLAPAGSGAAATPPTSLIKLLEGVTGQSRRQWPPTLLRRMWEAAIDVEAGRRQSPAHEERWLYLVGYALRPGYGLAVDDWRVAQTWRMLFGNRAHHTPACRAEWYILWRRLAGGLTDGQQRALAEPLAGQLEGGKSSRADAAGTGHEQAEIWRLVASLELLPTGMRVELGDMLARRLKREKVGGLVDAATWSLGRLGARQPQYGPLDRVVPVEAAARWFEAIVECLKGRERGALFPVVQIVRKTGDRYRDVDGRVREKALDWLRDRQSPPHYLELVRDGGTLAEEEQGLAFGESLPPGLRLATNS